MTWAAVAGGTIAAGGALGASMISKGGKNGLQTIQQAPYNGPRPWTPDQIGLGTSAITPLATQYLNQISQESQGKGLVGFDPAMLDMEHQNINADFAYQKQQDLNNIQGQAAGQGLRGGIPLTIGNEYLQSANRNQQNALNTVDIANLDAARTDRNTAQAAEPALVGQAAGMQDNASSFGLAEYQATQPTLIDQPPSQIPGQIIGAAGQLGSAYINSQNPQTALINQILQQQLNKGTTANTSGANTSIGSSYYSPLNSANVAQPY